MTSLYRLIQEFRDGTAAMDWEAWAEDVVASIDQRAAMADPGEHAPCPFCGSTNISSGEVLSGQMGNYAKQTSCLDCGANGPEVKMSLAMAQHADGDALADAAWNSRKPVCSACGDTGDIRDARRYRLLRDSYAPATLRKMAEMDGTAWDGFIDTNSAAGLPTSEVSSRPGTVSLETWRSRDAAKIMDAADEGCEKACAACHGSGRGNLLDVCGRCNGSGTTDVRASDGDGSRSGREWWGRCKAGADSVQGGEREHIDSPACWCEPTVEHEDEDVRVIVHRRMQ